MKAFFFFSEQYAQQYNRQNADDTGNEEAQTDSMDLEDPESLTFEEFLWYMKESINMLDYVLSKLEYAVNAYMAEITKFQNQFQSFNNSIIYLHLM